MTPECDVTDVTQSFALSAVETDVDPLDDGAGPGSLFQEINERRARIENTELLRHLRGL